MSLLECCICWQKRNTQQKIWNCVMSRGMFVDLHRRNKTRFSRNKLLNSSGFLRNRPSTAHHPWDLHFFQTERFTIFAKFWSVPSLRNFNSGTFCYFVGDRSFVEGGGSRSLVFSSAWEWPLGVLSAYLIRCFDCFQLVFRVYDQDTYLVPFWSIGWWKHVGIKKLLTNGIWLKLVWTIQL